MKRQAVRKSTRFEVFKRDSFTCQYCGAKAPEVVLEVDHITPVAGGGTSDILNLVTACQACNSGKSDRPLSDATAVQRARAQAEEMSERRRQLEMIADWHRSLMDTDEHAKDTLERLWLDASEHDEDDELTADARQSLLTAMKRYGFDTVCKAILQAASRWKESPPDYRTHEHRNELFWSIPKICSVLKLDSADPGVGRLFYIRGILRRRCHYLNDGACISLLKQARDIGVDVEWMVGVAKHVTSWSQFRNLIEDEMGLGNDEQEEADVE